MAPANEHHPPGTAPLYRQRGDLIVEHMEDEAIVLDVRAGRVHQLNSTASHIWEACDGITSIDGIVTTLVARCHGTPDILQVDADVRATLAEFERCRLVAPIAVGPHSEQGADHDPA